MLLDSVAAQQPSLQRNFHECQIQHALLRLFYDAVLPMSTETLQPSLQRNSDEIQAQHALLRSGMQQACSRAPKHCSHRSSVVSTKFKFSVHFSDFRTQQACSRVPKHCSHRSSARSMKFHLNLHCSEFGMQCCYA